MSLLILGQMVLAALLAIVLYIFIGFIPGTDETSVLLPISMAVILSGINPIVALTFFVASFVTLGLMNLMPTLIVGLPGGVMSSPIVEHSLMLKKEGRTAIAIKKGAVGSLIGVLVALPTSLTISKLIMPYVDFLKDNASWFFIGGALFLALLSSSKIISVLSIVPLALLFQGLRQVYWELGIVPLEKNITTSFFLGITVAPLLLTLLSLFNKEKREQEIIETIPPTYIPAIKNESLSPFNVLSKSELISSVGASFIANFLFVLSPVGLTILFGELAGKKEKNPIKKVETSIVTMSALAQSTYLSGLMISMIALGIPLSPSAIGPGAAFFNAPPVFDISQQQTIKSVLTSPQLMLAFAIGSLLAISIVYIVAMRLAAPITTFVLQKIPHEAILGLFISLILLLGYMDAGLLNLFGILLIGITSGTLNRLGVNYGVQFMTLYAAPALLQLFS